MDLYFFFSGISKPENSSGNNGSIVSTAIIMIAL